MQSLRFILIALVLCAAAPGAHAQTRATVIPSVSMGAVYDDNVSARARGDAGEMLQMRPSLEADYESATVKLISLWSFDMQRSNHSSLNRSEEHTSELQSRLHLVCRLLLEKKNKT